MIVRFMVSENESPAMFLEDYGLKLVGGCDSYWVEGDYVAGYDEYEVDVPQLSDVQISEYWAGSIINYFAEATERCRDGQKWYNYVTSWAPMEKGER